MVVLHHVVHGVLRGGVLGELLGDPRDVIRHAQVVVCPIFLRGVPTAGPAFVLRNLHGIRRGDLLAGPLHEPRHHDAGLSERAGADRLFQNRPDDVPQLFQYLLLGAGRLDELHVDLAVVRVFPNVLVLVGFEVDAPYVERLEHLLNVLHGSPRSRAEREGPKFNPAVPQHPDAPDVRMVTLGPVRLVDDHADDLVRGTDAGVDVVLHRLRRAEEDPLGAPEGSAGAALVLLRAPHHRARVFSGYAAYVAARRLLLVHQRARGGEENHLPLGKPPVEVVHHDSRDERLAQTCRQTHQAVGVQRPAHSLVLVIAPDELRRVHVRLSGDGVQHHASLGMDETLRVRGAEAPRGQARVGPAAARGGSRVRSVQVRVGSVLRPVLRPFCVPSRAAAEDAVVVGVVVAGVGVVEVDGHLVGVGLRVTAEAGGLWLTTMPASAAASKHGVERPLLVLDARPERHLPRAGLLGEHVVHGALVSVRGKMRAAARQRSVNLGVACEVVGSRPVGCPPGVSASVVAAEPALVPGVAAESRGVVVVARGMLGGASPLVVRGLSLLPGLVRMPLLRWLVPLLRRLVRLRRGLMMRRLIGARWWSVPPRGDHRVDVDGAKRIVPVVVGYLPHFDAPSCRPSDQQLCLWIRWSSNRGRIAVRTFLSLSRLLYVLFKLRFEWHASRVAPRCASIWPARLKISFSSGWDAQPACPTGCLRQISLPGTAPAAAPAAAPWGAIGIPSPRSSRRRSS